MPAPQYLILPDTRYGNRQVVKFGGQNIPIIGGAQGYIDLMDGVNWFLDPKYFGVEIKIDHKLTSSPYAWRAKSAFQSEDYWPCMVTLPLLYDESNGNSFQIARAALFGAGSQNLTFDNATGMICKLNTIVNLRQRITAKPYLWEGQFQFVGYEPFWKDFNASTQAGTALAGSVSPGTGTGFTITYPGNFWAEPVFVLDIPVGNGVAISQFALQNTSNINNTEKITIAFNPALAAATHWVLTIDCGAFTVTDQNGVQYDFSGSFPLLYQPAGTVNSFTATLTTASGASTGVTLTPSWTNRWMP